MKKVFSVICIFMTAAVMCACGNENKSQISYIEKELSLNLDGYSISEALETHGGFLGDGETFCVMKTAEDNADLYKQINSDWTPLPLSDELNEIIYGSSAMTYDVSIPEIENGYYYFADRSQESQNGKINKDIHPSRYALYNFTLSIYDSDNDILVYYELDT